MATEQRAFPAVDIKDVRNWLEKALVCVVDTRAPFEYAGGRIPGSLNLPGSSIRTRKGQVPAGREILILAADTDRALEGCGVARSLGFVVAGYVDGGFEAWADANYPVATISDGMGMPGPNPINNAS